VLTNAGVSVPGTIVNELRLASLDAFASATVTTIVYVSVVVRSGAVIVIVMVVVPVAAIGHTADAPAAACLASALVHAPAVEVNATVAPGSDVITSTPCSVVPLGTSTA
jgi:hypothetical protein